MQHDFFENRNFAALKQLLGEMNVVDIAEELEKMEDEAAAKTFRMLTKDQAAEVFAYLPRDMQQTIVEAITDREIGRIVEDLFLDDAVDFIEEMPASVVTRVLASVTPGTRDMINLLLKYPEDSAGSIMTIEFVELRRESTVRDAFGHIRRTGIDKETIYTCYVIDGERHLEGAVSARTLMLADQDSVIGDIMEQRIISAATTDDKESLANDFRKYGLLAMPVVDQENRLVGIVTVDDVLEIQEEEATEDFELMAAISPTDGEYLKIGVWTLVKARAPWLMLLMLSAMVTGTIITRFEDALAVVPALISFIPMLMDTGGNAGAQSSTMVIRGIALEEITLKDVPVVLWKELRVALLCGLALTTVNLARLMITGQDWLIGVTVSFTLYSTVIVAKMVGCLLPLCAKRLGFDPAVMASPIITTIVDAAALLVYFTTTRALLL